MFKEKILLYREGAPEDLSKYPALIGIPEKEDPDKKEVEKALFSMTEYQEITSDYKRIRASRFSSEQIHKHAKTAELLVLNKMNKTPGFDPGAFTAAVGAFSNLSSVIDVDLKGEELGRFVVTKTSGWIDVIDSAIATAKALFDSRQITKKELVQIKAVCELFSHAINSTTELILIKDRQAFLEDTSSDLFKSA